MLVEPRGETERPRVEPIEVKLAVSPVQTVLAVAACLVIFVAGFAIGRTTKATEFAQNAETISAVPENAGSPASIAEEAAPAAPETGPEPEPAESGEPVTVESLEARLAAIEVESIEFIAGSDELVPSSAAIVDEAAKVLVELPAIPVEIEVKTFSEATPGRNHGLSVLQAEAIARRLVDRGVEGSRLAAVGFGSSATSATALQPILLFESDDAELSVALADLDSTAVVLEAEGSIGTDGRTVLAQVADALERYPAASITLAGYAVAETPATSHERSHELVDAAAVDLGLRGIEGDRISAIGFGDAPIVLDLETEIEFEVGFPAAMTLALRQVDNERITFESGSDELTTEGLAALEEVAEAMGFDESTAVEISAHTYGQETSTANHDLSHRQGQAVVEVLVAAGVARDRLVVMGHGGPIHFAKPGRESYITFYPLG